VLEGSEAHHALSVLRVRAGDRVLVLNGGGLGATCEVKSVSRKSVNLGVVEHFEFERPGYYVTLFQAVLKNKAMDVVIQKAVELGVWRIVPVRCERSVVRFSGGEVDEKIERWRSVAIEAIKQCGAPWLPSIEAPKPVREAIHDAGKIEISFMAALRSQARHLREYFISFAEANNRPPRTIAVWIGPEGDFTDAEFAAMEASGVLPVTFGPRVLRSETAALYALAAVNYEMTFVGFGGARSRGNLPNDLA
ncbi:MAG: 16S rRNA (uracil(1498)-N(3))-methyltransferase, partial [Verrucomicrobiae bacterium]|nr:16S rRNA (uracil(1498)-N(3))-methyltransferase [Verrucomicrobiae bacterium]